MPDLRTWVSATLMTAGACQPAAAQETIEVATIPGGIRVPFQSHNQKVVQNAYGIFATRGDRESVPGHYMRFNATTGVREIDSYTDWGNPWGNPAIQSSDGGGLFASDPDDPLQLVYTGFAYSPWAAGLPGFTDTDPTHDPDHDGLDNQMEYAFALDPTKGTGAGPLTVLPQSFGKFRYTRRVRTLTGLNDIYQYTTTLADGDWHPIIPAAADVVTPGPAADMETVTVDLAGTPGKPSANGKLFVRVLATPTK